MKKVILIAISVAVFGLVGCSSHDAGYVDNKKSVATKHHKKCTKRGGGKFGKLGDRTECYDTAK